MKRYLNCFVIPSLICLSTACNILQAAKTLTDFFHAAATGDIKTIQSTLDASGNNGPKITINIQDEEGNTALHRACKVKNNKAVAFLLDNQADPLKQNNDGNTPLHFAAAQGNISCLQVFNDYKNKMEKQSVFNALNKNGQTVLMTAIQNSEFLFAQRLLAIPDVDIDVTTIDHAGNNAGHLAIQVHSSSTFFSLIVHKAYSQNYPMLLSENKNHDTCFHIAIFNGFNDVVDECFNLGKKFHPDLCYELLETQAGTPLDQALSAIKPRIAKLLIEKIQEKAEICKTKAQHDEAKLLEETARQAKVKAIRLFRKNFNSEFICNEAGEKIKDRNGNFIKLENRIKIALPPTLADWNEPIDEPEEEL